MRIFSVIVIFGFLRVNLAVAQSPYTPWRNEGFNPNTLKSSPSFFDPRRFSMQQSYTMSYLSGPNGSSSSGIYMNHLRFALTSSLSLYTDLGFYNIFHQSSSGLGSDNRGLADVNAPQFVIPQFGLTYQPSEHFTLMLNVITPDAYEMGYDPYSPFLRATGYDRMRSRLR